MINNFKIKDIRKEITGFKNKSICKKQMYPTYKHMYMEEPICQVQILSYCGW